MATLCGLCGPVEEVDRKRRKEVNAVKIEVRKVEAVKATQFMT